jgi:biopolymer transport protein TolQ
VGASSIIGLISHTGPVALGVLGFLLVFSVVSWAIIFGKLWMFRRAHGESAQFLRLYQETKNLKATYEDSKRFGRSPVASVFREGYSELRRAVEETSNPGGGGSGEGNPKSQDLIISLEPTQRLDRALRRASLREVAQMERHLIFLATTGNVAPFVGLFGTVWGIMNSFLGLAGAGSASLAAVAPGIAEALVTTAAGLAAAVPAVIGYTYFLSRVRGLAAQMDMFAMDFLSLSERIIARKR